MSSNLRVHITPVGFDFRRATEPLIKMRADKVYFLRYNQNDADKEFFASIKRELKDHLAYIQIEEIRIDNWNLDDCIATCRKIINEEKAKKNHVYVNVATGTRINSVAGMLACMIWDATPYYARLTYPEAMIKKVPPTEHVDDSDQLPVYKITKPDDTFMLILRVLEQNGGRMKKAELIKELEREGKIKPRDERAARQSDTWKHSQLRAWLYPMENEWKFVTVKAKGRRSEVSITEQGKTALKIFGVENIE